MKIKRTYRQYNITAIANTLFVLFLVASCNNEKKQGKSDTSIAETSWNSLSANHTVIARQTAVQPLVTDVDFILNGNGYITFDMRRNRKIAARVGGRIEKLYARYNYQHVQKGEKLFELYSPELNTYVEEYVYIRRQSNDTALESRAKQKLLLLGLTRQQINEIDATGQAPITIPVYSPYEGYVLFSPSGTGDISMSGTKNATPGMSGMPQAAAPSAAGGQALADNSIREGMYINKDQTLFWINDFKELWGIIAFTKENEKYINKGQRLIVTSELSAEQSLTTTVQLIEQVYQEGQKFTQARVYLANPSGRLKQNSLLTATASIHAKSLIVPASSVYYLGSTSIVWVKTGITKEGSYIFQARVVSIGHRDKNGVEILKGLSDQEMVAKDAGYLADSESIIN